MSNYFKEFPYIQYRFGNETYDVLFQQLNAYVDIIDQVKDAATLYTDYVIEEFERPDALSFKLYGTTNYDWTFFFLNDKLRKHNWPVSTQELLTLAQEYYPHIVLTTTQNIGFTGNIKRGDTVKLFNDESQTGTVIDFRPDLGQIIIDRSTFFTGGTSIIKFDRELNANFAVPFDIQLLQYNAINYYLNDSGDYPNLIDSVDAHSSLSEIKFVDTSSFTSVTNFEKMSNLNDDLRRIKVFKPDVIDGIVTEFRRSLGERV